MRFYNCINLFKKTLFSFTLTFLFENVGKTTGKSGKIDLIKINSFLINCHK